MASLLPGRRLARPDVPRVVRRHEVGADARGTLLPMPADTGRVLAVELHVDPTRWFVWVEHEDPPGVSGELGLLFVTVGTGDPVPEHARWLGTCRQDQFVFHLYAGVPGPATPDAVRA